MSDNSSEKIANIEESISYVFQDKSLILEALTHGSFSHENNLGYNYERLEFLGDAVLELVVSEYILNNHKNMNEGAMTKLRACVVNEKFLSGKARKLNIGNQIFLGKGETAGRDNNSILADILEAIIAAVYLDGGYDVARNVILPFLKNDIEDIANGSLLLDVKGELQKLSQKDYGVLPEYSVIGATGPDHNKTFTVKVEICGIVSVTGQGRSKKLAEKAAAAAALHTIRNR